MSEEFKTELRKLCMELDLDLGEYQTCTPFGASNSLRGCDLYKYYLTKMKVTGNEFIEEVHNYELEYQTNKKDVIYKKLNGDGFQVERPEQENGD